MLPLRDSVRPRSVPIANYTLIAANILVFMFEAAVPRGAFAQLLTQFGLVPARLTLAQPLTFLTMITSIFLHGSWFHLISNMWTLFIFGDNVEDRMGRARYVSFYILAGVLAGGSHAYFTAGSTVPTVGASGAIAGILGAYLVLFPQGRVLTLILLFVLPWFVEIPAFIYLGVWFFSQLSSALLSLGNLGAGTQFSGIAWWAHIGGFVAGMLFVGLFVRRRTQRWTSEFDPW